MRNRIGGRALIIAAVLTASSIASVDEDILALTGGRRAKFVWSRQTDGVNRPYGGGEYRLMRFDTDAKAEADVMGDSAEYFRAKLTWDGKRIVYETETHICTIRPDGTGNRLVTYYGGVQRYGRFSPDGKAIVFCQAPSPRGPWELYVVPSAGGTPRKLTDGGSDMYAHWR